MSDETRNPTESPAPKADESFAWTGDGDTDGTSSESPSGGREWLSQLQSMIENVTEQAGPALRQISAKAAELAAVAGDKAGPVAARAAEFTAEAGSKLAVRSRELATELRRDQAARATAAETGSTSAEGKPSSDEAAKD